MATSAAGGLLARQLKQMQGDKDIPGISCGVADGNIFEWEVMLMINDDCRFYGGETRPFLHPEDLFLNFTDTITSFRWIFPCTALLSAGIPSPSTEDEI
jgi:hypothetical protein